MLITTTESNPMGIFDVQQLTSDLTECRKQIWNGWMEKKSLDELVKLRDSQFDWRKL